MTRSTLLVCIALLAGCGAAPAAPTPNAKATIEAAVKATVQVTNQAQPTATPVRGPIAPPAAAATTAPAGAAAKPAATTAPAAGATRPAPTATTAPTVAPTTAPTATAAPAAVPKQVAAELASDGLGLTRAEWEAKRGKPTRDDGMLVSYEGNRYLVMFYEGRVWNLTHAWGDRNATSLEEAIATGKTLLPQDAVPVRTYTASDDRRVDVYQSEALAAVWPPKAFGVSENDEEDDEDARVEVGDCIVIYKQAANGRVHTIIVAAGNNP